MSTSDLTVTLVGWVGTEPKHYTGTGVTPFTSFRMANTRRYFDRAQNAWTDGRTEWFTVKVWRHSALNVASSLRKGDPVLVHGRLSTEHWDGPDGPRTTLVLEALAIGPDLTYGRATFARTVHVAGGTAGGGSDDAGQESGAPEAGDGVDTVAYGFEDPWATDGLDGADAEGGGTDASTHGGTGAGAAGDDGSDARPGDAADGAEHAPATDVGGARGKRARSVEAAVV